MRSALRAGDWQIILLIGSSMTVTREGQNSPKILRKAINGLFLFQSHLWREFRPSVRGRGLGGMFPSIADAFPPMSELYQQRKMMKGGEVAVIKANEGGEEGGLAIYIAVAAGVADRVQGNQVVLGNISWNAI